MSCKHPRYYDDVHPDMGSFPASWNCPDCGKTLGITWLPKWWTRDEDPDSHPRPPCTKDPKGHFHEEGEDCSQFTHPRPKEEDALRKKIDNLEKWGTHDIILVKHFKEEREWRKALLDWLESLGFTPTPKNGVYPLAEIKSRSR